jgi:hypothetical protein
MQRAILLATLIFALTNCASRWDEIQSEQAATVGVNYRRAAKRAYAGDEAALATMFRVTRALDGGGAEAHSDDLHRLLTVYGDARFAGILRQERRAVRQSVIDSLDFAFLVYVRQPNWSAQFPQTYAIAPHPVLRLPRPGT